MGRELVQGNTALRIPSRTISRPTLWQKGLLERILKKSKGPMEKLENEFSKQKTGDKILAMKNAILITLHEEGYSKELRAGVIARKPSDTTDLMFTAALEIFEDECGKLCDDAGRMAEDLLLRVSDESICEKLSYLKPTSMLSRGTESKRERTATVLAKMCRHVAFKAERLVEKITDNVSALKEHGTEMEQKAAAVFLDKVRVQIIDIPAVA
ncbi:MAG: hypothetical protein ABH983_06065 [Candidatus Micrarchaeota archaeon]